MHQQRPHRHNAAAGNNALDRCDAGSQGGNRLVGEHSECMCVRQNAQWTVRRRGIIQVEPECHDMLQGARWRMGIQNASFHGPRAPANRVAPLAKGQCGVLMPRDKPIRGGRLIEERGPKWKGPASKEFVGKAQQPRAFGRFGDDRNPHQVARAGASPGQLNSRQRSH